MKYFKIDKNISYVFEEDSVIILNFREGEFSLLNGLYAKIIRLIDENSKVICEHELKSKLLKNENFSYEKVISKLVENGIVICEWVEHENDKKN